MKRTAKITSGKSFRERVLAVVAAIPKGETLTYGDVAWLAGSAGAARAVGTIMSQNYDPKIPCHRVVRADGQPGEWNRGRQNKEFLLRKEGALNEGKLHAAKYSGKSARKSTRNSARKIAKAASGKQ